MFAYPRTMYLFLRFSPSGSCRPNRLSLRPNPLSSSGVLLRLFRASPPPRSLSGPVQVFKKNAVIPRCFCVRPTRLLSNVQSLFFFASCFPGAFPDFVCFSLLFVRRYFLFFPQVHPVLPSRFAFLSLLGRFPVSRSC